MIRAFLLIIFLTSGSAALRHALDNDAVAEGIASNQNLQIARAEPEVERARVRVAVASRAIQSGYQLSASDLGWVRMPIESVSPDFILDGDASVSVDELIGRIAARDIAAGDPILLQDLRDMSERSLSGRLLPGMRAFSVLIDQEAMAGGLIMPGDRVDVVYTFYPQDSETAASMIIAANVRVLALDDMTEFGQREELSEDDPPNERNATLELSPDQIGRVSAAEEDGRLRLALRSADEIAGPAPVNSPIIRVNRGGVVSFEMR
jgi:pilus assembly protein CpaB